MRQTFLKKILEKVDKIGNGFMPYMKHPRNLNVESILNKKKKLEDVFADCLMRFQMDMQNKIESFEDTGMVDPFRFDESLEEVKQIVEEQDFSTDVYPQQIMGPLRREIKEKPDLVIFDHPKLIFVPSQEIIRTMIRALVEWGNKEPENIFLLRFGLLENPIAYFRAN